jgi:CubicO group peptidase (beta-lactamase class C family)
MKRGLIRRLYYRHVSLLANIDSVRGEVCGTAHDESTAVLGGVAGHAGLFGTADDMLRFGQAWLATLAGTCHGVLMWHWLSRHSKPKP